MFSGFRASRGPSWRCEKMEKPSAKAGSSFSASLRMAGDGPSVAGNSRLYVFKVSITKSGGRQPLNWSARVV